MQPSRHSGGQHIPPELVATWSTFRLRTTLPMLRAERGAKLRKCGADFRQRNASSKVETFAPVARYSRCASSCSSPDLRLYSAKILSCLQAATGSAQAMRIMSSH